jgi:DNA uptake protein ComE-like DNA-binding protein
MSKKLKEYLNFSPLERTGLILLLAVIICLVTGNLLLNKAHLPEIEYDYSRYERQIESVKKDFINTPSQAVIKQNKEKTEHKPFRFDPNKASVYELEKAGIKKNIACRIIAYRKKGGRFLKKEDLMKIYGFDSVQYALINPYIEIQPDITTTQAGLNHGETAQTFIIELNTTDTTCLKKLQGIGSVLSSRIIKYRELLGGFFSVRQLHEVYGITDSLFSQIEPYLKADTTLIKKLNINEASMNQLIRHPYVGEYTARAILTYRKTCGTIKSFDELVTNKIIAPSEKNKIKPYFLLR